MYCLNSIDHQSHFRQIKILNQSCIILTWKEIFSKNHSKHKAEAVFTEIKPVQTVMYTMKEKSPEMETGEKFHEYNRQGTAAQVKEKYQDSIYVPSEDK